MIRYREYRHEQDKIREEWLAHKCERGEGLARGEDPRTEVEAGL